MKYTTYSFGNYYNYNNDKIITEVSNLITKPTEMRNLLTDNLFISKDVNNRLSQIRKGIELIDDKKKYDPENISLINEITQKIIKVDEYKKL
jgi:hypothetical protein